MNDSLRNTVTHKNTLFAFGIAICVLLIFGGTVTYLTNRYGLEALRETPEPLALAREQGFPLTWEETGLPIPSENSPAIALLDQAEAAIEGSLSELNRQLGRSALTDDPTGRNELFARADFQRATAILSELEMGAPVTLAWPIGSQSLSTIDMNPVSRVTTAVRMLCFSAIMHLERGNIAQAESQLTAATRWARQLDPTTRAIAPVASTVHHDEILIFQIWMLSLRGLNAKSLAFHESLLQAEPAKTDLMTSLNLSFLFHWEFLQDSREDPDVLRVYQGSDGPRLPFKSHSLEVHRQEATLVRVLSEIKTAVQQPDRIHWPEQFDAWQDAATVGSSLATSAVMALRFDFARASRLELLACAAKQIAAAGRALLANPDADPQSFLGECHHWWLGESAEAVVSDGQLRVTLPGLNQSRTPGETGEPLEFAFRIADLPSID